MYVLKNKRYILFVSLIDTIGKALFYMSGIKKRALPKEIRKILIIRLDHIGDLIFILPTIKKMREAFPQAKITLIVSPWGEEIFKGNRDIDELIILKSNWFQRGDKRYFSILEIVRLVLKIRRDNYDIGIDLRGDIRNILILFLSGIKIRMGYGIAGGGFLLSHEMEYVKGIHQIEKNLKFLEPLCSSISGDISLELPVLKEDEVYIEDILNKNKIYKEDIMISISLSAGSASRRWGADKFIKLLNAIHIKGFAKIVITGSIDEKEFIDSIVKGLSFSPVNLTGCTNIRQFAALLKRADLLIGCNSGPVHIASAVGTPAVVIFSGTNDSSEWGPYGNDNIIIKKGTLCSPCELKECAIEGHPCMDISEEEVLEAVSVQLSAVRLRKADSLNL